MRALGHIGGRLGATPADGLLDPFRRAAQLGGGEAVGLAETAGLHAAGTDALVRGPGVRDARRRRPTSPAPGRALRDPAGGGVRAIGAPLPVPQAESSAQVLPGHGHRSGSGPADVDSPARGRPGGGAAVPAAGRCVADDVRRLHAVAVPGRADRHRATRRPARPGAGGVRPGMGGVPETGRRAGATPSREPAGAGPVHAGLPGNRARVGRSRPDAGARCLRRRRPARLSGGFTPPASNPIRPPVVRVPPPARTPTPATTARPTSPPTPATPRRSARPPRRQRRTVAPPPGRRNRLPRLRSCTPSASPSVATSSPGRRRAPAPPRDASGRPFATPSLGRTCRAARPAVRSAAPVA